MLFALFAAILYTQPLAESSDTGRQVLPIVLAGCEPDFPPFCTYDSTGTADGFSIELLSQVLGAVGLRPQFETAQRTVLQSRLKSGQIDVLPHIARTPERELLYDFSIPYLATQGGIIVRKTDSKISSAKDLSGREIAVLNGGIAQEFLQREFPLCNLHPCATHAEMLRKLSQGQFDAAVMQKVAVGHLIQNEQLHDLKMLPSALPGYYQQVCFAVKKGNARLLSQLNEGLSLVQQNGTFARLHAKWFWLSTPNRTAQILIGGDKFYPPYEFLDSTGQPAGYNVDLSRAIAKVLGIDIEIRLDDWAVSYTQLKTGKIDLVHGMFFSSQRDSTFDFSPPHATLSHVAVVRKGAPPISSVQQLAGKKIAVLDGDLMHEFALSKGFGANITAYSVVEEGLWAVSNGSHDCMLTSKLPALYLIRQHRIPRLQVCAASLYDAEYCYAAANGNNVLLSRFTEGLAVLKRSGEYYRIQSKWLGDDTYQMSFMRVLRRVAIIIVPLLLLTAIMIGAVVLLRRTVAHRTRELETEIAQRKHREQINALLLDASRSILQSESFDTAARKIFDACREATGARSGYIALLSPNGQENKVLFLEAGGMPCTVDPSLPMPIRGLRAQAYQTNSVACENDFSKSDWMKFMPSGHVHLRNVLFAPLVIENKTVGIMGLANKDGDFTDEDKKYAGAFGELAAIALSNSRGRDELNRERDRAQSYLDIVASLVLGLDTDGVITLINPGGARLLESTQEELIGKNWFEHFIEEPDRQQVKAMFLEILREDRKLDEDSENPIVTARGTKRIIRWHNTVLHDEQGKATGTLSSGTDVTDQHQMEQRLRRSEKMEAIGLLAGGIAHDFNNILGGIVGCVDLSLDHVPSDGKVAKNLNLILKSTDRAKQLVKQILAFSRQTPQPLESLFPGPIIEEAIALLHATLPSSIEIYSRIQPQSAPILANATALHEVLINLATNAAHAMNEKGVLSITCEERIVTQPRETAVGGQLNAGNYTVLIVSDNGTGIPASILPIIFDPFFTTKEVNKGTGLGLSVVFGIVKSHRGFIDVVSIVGAGTTFEIFFPQTTEPTKSPQKTGSIVLGGKERILVVDDEEVLAMLMHDILEELGYSVTLFTSSENAFAAFNNEPSLFDMVITDQTMPSLSGVDLAAAFKKVRPDIAVLLVTGYRNALTEEVISNKGVDGFLMKPIKKNDLARKVRQIFDQRGKAPSA